MSQRDALREKALRTLEFDKVLESLAALVSFPPARDLALRLKPSYTHDEVTRLQAETRDALKLLETRPNLSLDGARDILHHVQTATLGGVLAGTDMLEVAETLAVTHYIHGVLLRSKEMLGPLADLGERLTELREEEALVRRTLDSKGEVVDGASDLLRRLRQEEKTAHQRLTARLQEIVASAQGRQVLQEPFITTRDGRYVLAVRADMRGQINGLIHDISSSGATVFMEPFATVEIGNAWREIKIAERREVERVLREISALIGGHGEAILTNLDLMARIDLVLAKGKLALKSHAILPALLPAPRDGPAQNAINLVNARHPLLTGDVVPMTLDLGKDFRALVISGPNTGGKTVALKNAGLLALMAQAGLAIPADRGSALRVFDGVYADIGDEQSIQQSLSTFSGHMSNIVRILEATTHRSLVLLDELGAGTDPLEGSAIARAILSSLVRIEATAIVTTHHSELKAFAHATPGLQNASMEFDAATLAPTFRLVVGLPGRSNALAIAERLGLPKHILQEAREGVGSRETEADALLRQIQEERDGAARERAAAERTRKELQETQAKLEAKVRQIEEEHRRTALVRRAEVQVLAEELRSRLREVARKIERLAGENGKKELAVLHADMAHVRRRLAGPEFQAPIPEEIMRQDKLSPGDRVVVEGVEQSAEVVSGPDERQMVDLRVGGVRMRVRRDLIKGRDRRPPPMESRVFVARGAAAKAQVGDELWVHGMRAQQAVAAVDEYLEKAALAGHHQVRIIHGKGKGILRSAIHRGLGDHQLVGTFRDAEPNEGGEGVTIVEL